MTNLERASHASLILFSAVSLALLLEHRLAPVPLERASLYSPLIGRHLDVGGRHWTDARLSAVLIISTGCHFCKESSPFYRELAERRRARAPHSGLVVLSREPSRQVQDYMAAERVSVDEVYQVTGELASTGTPAILLVDSAGIVKRAYIGKLSKVQEREVLNYVERSAV